VLIAAYDQPLDGLVRAQLDGVIQVAGTRGKAGPTIQMRGHSAIERLLGRRLPGEPSIVGGKIGKESSHGIPSYFATARTTSTASGVALEMIIQSPNKSVVGEAL